MQLHEQFEPMPSPKRLCPKRTSLVLLGIFLLLAVGAAGVYGWVEQRNAALSSGKPKTLGQPEAKAQEQNKEQAPVVEKKVDIAPLPMQSTAVNPETTTVEPSQNQDSQLAQNPPQPTPVQSSAMPKPFTFAVIADAESFDAPGYNPELPTMIAKVKSFQPDIVFFSGDIITAGSPGTLKTRLADIKQKITSAFDQFYIAFGKHDAPECGDPCVDVWEKDFFNFTRKPGEPRNLYHSFDHENTHFVLLSSDYPIKHTMDDAQLDWLKKDLAATKQPNKIVLVHVPPVTFFKESAKECHDMSCNAAQQQKLQNILQQSNVDLVISGHEHTFDHKIVNNIDYIIAGNTGNSVRYDGALKGDIFTSVRVDGTKISLKAIDINGKVVREIGIK